jgi:ankyrin repeat protein
MLGFRLLTLGWGGRRPVRRAALLAIRITEPLAAAATAAIRGGDLEALGRLLAGHPDLATARLIRPHSRTGADTSHTLVHVATDWPGHFPNGVKTVATLVQAGADVNARADGPHTETPLHWAASSDDVEVLDTLIDAGADIEASGAVIGGGTPLDDAVAFGQWQAARRLVERGAQTKLWNAAALGLMDRVEQSFAGATPPGPQEITAAFWCACHGGQQATAEYLLARGADLDWIGWDNLTPLEAARRTSAGPLVEWLRNQGARAASELG